MRGWKMGSALAATAAVSVIGLVGGGAAAQRSVPAEHHTMTILTGAEDHRPGWPRYTDGNFTVRAGTKVVITIRNHDDGPATIPAIFTQPQGLVGGGERINGKWVSRVNPRTLAHTWTIPGLHLNIVVPAAPKGKTDTVVATVRFSKPGVYRWQCEAPCGTGATGWGGAMVHMGFMEGAVHVVPDRGTTHA